MKVFHTSLRLSSTHASLLHIFLSWRVFPLTKCYCFALHIHHCWDWGSLSVGRDPNGSIIAFYDMMKKQIVMPAHLMNDNAHQLDTGRNLFKDFSSVAQTTGTYTAQVLHFSMTALLFVPWWLIHTCRIDCHLQDSANIVAGHCTIAGVWREE